MIITFLKILVAIYGATKLISLGAKEPAKSFFDKIDFKANGFLVSIKNQSTKAVLLKTSRNLFFLNVVLFAGFILVSFVFGPLPPEIVVNWGVLFFSTVLLNIAIPWNLNHTAFIKEFFLKSPLMLIPASPILGVGLGYLYQIDMLAIFKTITMFQELFISVGSNQFYFGITLSILFFIMYILVPYVQFWIVLLPIFYVFMGLTALMQLSLNLTHKHVNENLLAVLMGVLGIIVAGL